MGETADPGIRRRTRWAVALLLVGLVVAFVPGLAAGDRFLPDLFPLYTFEGRLPALSGATFKSISIDLNQLGFGPRRRVPTYVWLDVSHTSLYDLVCHHAGWAIPAATLLAAPLLFLWWRRSAVGFGRLAGIACCAVASASVCALVLTRRLNDIVPPGWIWTTVPAGGALMAAAFLVAPPPRRRDDA